MKSSTKADRESHTKLYRVLSGIKKRCKNKNSKDYKNYGGKGISVCYEWQSYKKFKEWALLNGYKEELTIDRIDNSVGYYPDNCRWVTRSIQARNTRRLMSTNTSGYRGVSKCNNKWQSKIKINSISIYIGRYDTAKEAGDAYDKYIRENNLEHTQNNDLEETEIKNEV